MPSVLLSLLLLSGRATAQPEKKDDGKTAVEAATEEKPERPCAKANAKFGQAEKNLAGATLSRFDGDQETYAKAKDALMRARDIARNELAFCVVAQARKSDVCARKLKELAKAQTDYDDPGMQDTDGELTRKTHAAAADLESCLLEADVDIPKGFIDKHRARVAKAAEAEVLK